MKNKIKLIAGVLGVVAALSPNFALAAEKQEIWSFNEVKTIQKGETIDFSKYYAVLRGKIKDEINRVVILSNGSYALANKIDGINDVSELDEGEYILELLSDNHEIGDQKFATREEWNKAISQKDLYAKAECVNEPSVLPGHIERLFNEGIVWATGMGCYLEKVDGTGISASSGTNGIYRKIKVVAAAQNDQNQDNSDTLETEKSGDSAIQEPSKSLQFTAPNTGFDSGASAFTLFALSLLSLGTFFIRKK